MNYKSLFFLPCLGLGLALMLFGCGRSDTADISADEESAPKTVADSAHEPRESAASAQMRENEARLAEMLEATEQAAIDTVPTPSVLPEEYAEITPSPPEPELSPDVPQPGERGIALSPSLSELGRAFEDDPSEYSSFEMPLPDGSEVEIIVDRFERIGSRGGQFEGTVRGQPGSRVSLSFRGGAEAGEIHLPGANKRFVIMPGSDGEFFFREHDDYTVTPSSVPMDIPTDIPPPPDFTPPPPPDMEDFPELRSEVTETSD